VDDEIGKISCKHIILSLFVCVGGTIGGWALAGKLAGDKAALSFLLVGLTVVLIMTGVQLVFYFLGESRLVYRVLFNIAFGCGLVWFMLCLLLPILWVDKFDVTFKTLFFVLLLVLCVVNVSKAGAQFKTKWEGEGEKAIAHYYDNNSGSVDWPKVLAPMKFSVALYIPGVSERLNPFISVAMLLGMGSGLSFRNAYPIFSLYAWGMPFCLVISMFAQVLGLGLAQVIKLVALEKGYGKPIRPKS
jgi:hypothetical protein